MRNYEHDNAKAVKNRSGEEEEKGCGKIRRTYGTLHATGCSRKHRKYVKERSTNVERREDKTFSMLRNLKFKCVRRCSTRYGSNVRHCSTNIKVRIWENIL